MPFQKKQCLRQTVQGRSHTTKWKHNRLPKQQNLIKRKIRQSVVTLLRVKKRFKKHSDFVFPKLTFQRLIREICLKPLQTGYIRFQPVALMALQEAAEHFLINLFEDSLQCALHTHRITVMVQDMILVHRIRARNVNC